MKSIVTFQLKGSNHKTSLTGTLGHMLSLEHKVLVIDLDVQSNLTLWLTGRKRDDIQYEFADLMKSECTIKEAVIEIGTIHLLGTLPDTNKILEYTENTLPNDTFVFLEFKEALEKMGYDYVLWDLSPSLSLLNRCVLLQADIVLTPVVPEFFSLIGMVNITKSLDDLAVKNKRVQGVKIPKPTIAISGVNDSYKQHAQVIDAIEKQGIKIVTKLPQDPIFRTAQQKGKSIFDVPGTKPKKETELGLKILVEAIK